MSEFKYKMVNGELVELTPAEVAEFEAMKANPPPPLPGLEQTPEPAGKSGVAPTGAKK